MCNAPTKSMFQVPLLQSPAGPASQALQKGAFVLQPSSVVHQNFCSLEAPLLGNIPCSQAQVRRPEMFGQLLPELNLWKPKMLKSPNYIIQMMGNCTIFQTSLWTLGWSSSVRTWDDSARMFRDGIMTEIEGFHGKERHH